MVPSTLGRRLHACVSVLLAASRVPRLPVCFSLHQLCLRHIVSDSDGEGDDGDGAGGVNDAGGGEDTPRAPRETLAHTVRWLSLMCVPENKSLVATLTNQA